MEVDNENFTNKFHEIIDMKKYSWDDFEKFKKVISQLWGLKL